MKKYLTVVITAIIWFWLSSVEASNCKSEFKTPGPLVVGIVVNDEDIPIIGATVEISFNEQNRVNVKTDDNGCFSSMLNTSSQAAPIAVAVKRKIESAVLARVVNRCQLDSNNICEFPPIKIVSPNTVFLLPFEGDETNEVFLSKQFRSALSKRFINNLQELEGENVLRKLKTSGDIRNFQKLKPPSLKLYQARNAKNFEVSDFEKLDRLGNDLNALALITGATNLDEESQQVDMSSFYQVPDITTWTLDDQLDAKNLKSIIVLTRTLNPQWTYYTMITVAKREIEEAYASPNKPQQLQRIKAYLQAQLNQFDSRSRIDQTELLDMLCEVRQALGEKCGELLLSAE